MVQYCPLWDGPTGDAGWRSQWLRSEFTGSPALACVRQRHLPIGYGPGGVASSPPCGTVSNAAKAPRTEAPRGVVRLPGRPIISITSGLPGQRPGKPLVIDITVKSSRQCAKSAVATNPVLGMINGTFLCKNTGFILQLLKSL